jgi:hypothetical protein
MDHECNYFCGLPVSGLSHAFVIYKLAYLVFIDWAKLSMTAPKFRAIQITFVFDVHLLCAMVDQRRPWSHLE